MPINAKKILVVGGAGYIGSHMVLMLRQAGYVPVVLDNLSTGHRNALPDDVLFVEADMGNTQALELLFKEHIFIAVMHFASFIAVGESMAHPLKYYQNNVAATLELLSVMLHYQVKHFIFSSSAAVYGDPKAKLMNELHQLAPVSPYGKSKVMVEQVLRDLAKSDGLRYGILRYFNAAGADPDGRAGERHPHESHLIPLLLQVAAGQAKNITIHGNHHATQDGTCVRDYVHVVDICQAHLLVLQQLLKDKAEMTCNIGTGHGYSVLQVIKAVERITGTSIQKMIGSSRPGDPATLVADSAKIREELGWVPRYPDLEAMIQHAWNYVKINEVNDATENH